MAANGTGKLKVSTGPFGNDSLLQATVAQYDIEGGIVEHHLTEYLVKDVFSVISTVLCSTSRGLLSESATV